MKYANTDFIYLRSQQEIPIDYRNLLTSSFSFLPLRFTLFGWFFFDDAVRGTNERVCEIERALSRLDVLSRLLSRFHTLSRLLSRFPALSRLLSRSHTLSHRVLRRWATLLPGTD